MPNYANHAIDRHHANAIRQALMGVRDALDRLRLDGCDMDDLREILDRASSELDASLPSSATLGTFLNSLARSLRSEPKVRTVLMELDAAMRDAHVPTNWEH